MLRLGILLPSAHHGGPELRAWSAALVRQLQELPDVRVTVVDVCPVASTGSDGDGLAHALFRRYEQWDARRLPAREFALTPAAPSDLPPEVPVLALDKDPAHWAAALQEYELDLLLCLDASVARPLPGAARLGVWLLDVAETLGKASTPPLWLQHTQNQPAVTRVLHLSDDGAAPRVVYETWTAMDPFSLAQSRSPVYWKGVEVALRSVTRLAAEGPAWLAQLPDCATPTLRPSGLSMGRFVWNELLRRVRARSSSARRATFAKWCIGLRQRDAATPYSSDAGYTLMVSPTDRFYADPFLFAHGGQTWLFFEDFRYPEGRAVISCCAVNERGEPGTPFEVLRLPFHLSYPFVFEHEGAVYMIPESRGNRTVTLYRATDFPRGWERDTDLFTGVDMVDTTLHHDGQRWWLFAGVSNGRYSNSDELCIFSAGELRGPWLPHPENPVVSDVRRARPAGRLFREGERLIRPSQDCGPAYGYGLVFSEILELTPERYREQVLTEITPESIPGNTANHTYTRTDRVETTDRFFIESRLNTVETFARSVPAEADGAA